MSIIRLQKICIENFKNIRKGEFSISKESNLETFDYKSDILGIYGQNGSGKTAIVDSLKILQLMISGERLSKEVFDYIEGFSKESNLSYTFYVNIDEKKYMVIYDFTISKIENNGNKEFILRKESLRYKEHIKDSEWTKVKKIIEYTESSILPKKSLELINKISKDNDVEFKVHKRLSEEKKESFIFSEWLKNQFEKIEELNKGFAIIRELKKYGKINLFIIDNTHSGITSGNILIPISFRIKDEKSLTQGYIPVSLQEPSVLGIKEYEMVKKVLKSMNLVINSIIPGLKLEIKEYGKEMIKESNSDGIRFELLSKRNDLLIPIKYESDGIKKLISILGTLIVMYNNSSFCLVIDELDSGIFEYLLGELLNILESRGKGQLIFTSHNLRPLEILKSNNIVFTTTNPDNKYIRIPSVKTNNNLRNVYMRHIALDGANETLYEETNNTDISRAFKLSGSED